MSLPPTGTVTFLFTDIEGSTHLAQAHPAEWPALQARHHAILRAAIESHGGYVFRIIGDAFCAAFATAHGGFAAALASQRGLSMEVWPVASIHARMGLHTGAVEWQRDDYEGYLTLARVQRIMSMAVGGQVLLSQTTADLISGDLPPDVALRDLGEHRLKDLQRPEHLYQLTAADLLADFPPLRTVDMISNNLPTQLSSFIGRERELADVKELLFANRLLTLTGPGGTGKTRISLQLAAEVLDAFSAGVWLVELAPLADPTLIPQTLADVLGIREQQGRPILDLLIDYLRAKQLLLILDNCEHLIDASARIADGLLRTCPQLKILTSSREPLGLSGEMSYRVPPLSLPAGEAPADVAAALRYDCVQLFADRARSVQSQFRLSEKNVRAVMQICTRLDGIPLAVELAAARVPVLSVEQIAARLDDRFRLLTGGGRTALPRQQTLRALIDWSYHLLSDSERATLQRLAVFAGGWTLEAAEAVCPELDVLSALGQLANKSLLIVEERADEARYRLLETVRQYAQEKLLETGATATVRQRHLDYFLRVAEQADVEWIGPQMRAWLKRLDLEHDNLRVAFEWALESQPEMALRLSGALDFYWAGRSQMSEARRWCQSALARASALPPADGHAQQVRAGLQARAYSAMAWAAITQGDHRAGLAAAEDGAALARQAADGRTLVMLLRTMALAAAFLGDFPRALSLAQESVALGRQIGSKPELTMALAALSQIRMTLGHADSDVKPIFEESIALGRELDSAFATVASVMALGRMASQRGDLVTAREKFEAVAAIFRDQGDSRMEASIHSEFAHQLRRHGDLAAARDIYRQTILVWQDMGHRAAVAHELECLAIIAAAQAQAQYATRLFGAAASLRAVIGTPMTPAENMEYERTLSTIRSQLDEATFNAAWAEGRALTLEQAIALALRDDP